MTTSQQERALRLRELHSAKPETGPLALANAWDVASALISVQSGAPAVATTSCGVAWSLGAPDGDRIDRALAVDLVARVAAAVDVPVTADIEQGFGTTPEEVAESIRLFLAAGAVGVNIEDVSADDPGALREVDDQCARIRAARAAADEAGVDLFINVRTDSYLRGLPDAEKTTIARAEAYLAAGASGVFVPGVTDVDTIRALAAAIDAPLNVMAGPGAPSVSELAAAGAARVSLGGAVSQAAYGVTGRAMREFYQHGTYAELADPMSYPDLNGLFEH